MKPKVKDVYEPFNSLARLMTKHSMAEMLASLAAIAEMTAQDQTDERHMTEAARLRDVLIREAERCQRFQDGELSAEDQAGWN